MKTKLEQGDVVIFDGSVYSVETVVSSIVTGEALCGMKPLSGETSHIYVPGKWIDALAENLYSKRLTVVPRDAVQAIRGFNQTLGGSTITVISAERPE